MEAYIVAAKTPNLKRRHNSRSKTSNKSPAKDNGSDSIYS